MAIGLIEHSRFTDNGNVCLAVCVCTCVCVCVTALHVHAHIHVHAHTQATYLRFYKGFTQEVLNFGNQPACNLVSTVQLFPTSVC